MNQLYWFIYQQETYINIFFSKSNFHFHDEGVWLSRSDILKNIWVEKPSLWLDVKNALRLEPAGRGVWNCSRLCKKKSMCGGFLCWQSCCRAVHWAVPCCWFQQHQSRSRPHSLWSESWEKDDSRLTAATPFSAKKWCAAVAQHWNAALVQLLNRPVTCFVFFKFHVWRRNLLVLVNHKGNKAMTEIVHVNTIRLKTEQFFSPSGT